MIKQALIYTAFCIVGAALIAVICCAFLPKDYALVVSPLCGGLWGFYVAHRAIRSGAFNGEV